MQTISTTDLAHRLRPVIARLARRMRQQAGGDLSPTQGAALNTIACHGPLTPSELAAREKIQRPDRHARARAAGGGRADRAHRRSRRPPLEPGRRDRRRATRCSPPSRERKDAYLAQRLDRLSPEDLAVLERAAGILERVLEEGARVSPALARTFSSLKVPNYRRYFGGQLVSITGNWMQTVGEMWLMVKLTGSGSLVGLTAGLQFLPILLFGAWGGLLADRLPKRRVLTYTQLSLAVPALTLFFLAAIGRREAVDGARAGPGARLACWRSTTRRASRSWSRSSAPTASSTRSR